ncbi:hypothetical protein Syun_019717 [Stephania yunnanensis]|uniref:NAC domain-containing protein n=1 Tax=Stephania yunnanensis TaxID=152371 RepID=A0AAP0IVT6_9MAGN
MGAGMKAATWVVNKRMTASDVRADLSRLFIPSECAWKLEGLLSAEEMRKARVQGKKNSEEVLVVKMVDGNGGVSDLDFKYWTSLNKYVFTNQWTQFVDKFQVKEGWIVEIWCFRDQHSLLCRAAEVTAEEEEGIYGGGGEEGAMAAEEEGQRSEISGGRRKEEVVMLVKISNRNTRSDSFFAIPRSRLLLHRSSLFDNRSQVLDADEELRLVTAGFVEVCLECPYKERTPFLMSWGRRKIRSTLKNNREFSRPPQKQLAQPSRPLMITGAGEDHDDDDDEEKLDFNSELFDLSMVASLALISLMMPLGRTLHLYANKFGPIHYLSGKVRNPGNGRWIASNGLFNIFSSEGEMMGERRSLVYYNSKEKIPAKKTRWIMNEYRLPNLRPAIMSDSSSKVLQEAAPTGRIGSLLLPDQLDDNSTDDEEVGDDQDWIENLESTLEVDDEEQQPLQQLPLIHQPLFEQHQSWPQVLQQQHTEDNIITVEDYDDIPPCIFLDEYQGNFDSWMETIKKCGHDDQQQQVDVEEEPSPKRAKAAN